MNTQLISVIVPVYKAEKYLPKCIDSILAQTYTNLELLLINDGSPDNCGKICDEYAATDSRIRVFHKNNGGVSSARNLGLDNVIGNWVCFIDSDDWVEDSFLSDFKINEYDADMYISGALYIINDQVYSQKKYQPSYINIDYTIKDELFRQNLWQNGYPWGKLFKYKIIQDNNMHFDEFLSIHEDHIFIFEYYSYISSVYVSDVAKYNYLSYCDTESKLTNVVNSYNVMYRACKKFDFILKPMCNHLGLSKQEHNSLYKHFVLRTRFNALYCLFCSSHNQKGKYKQFYKEVTFWQIYLNTHDGLSNGLFYNIVIKIIRWVKYTPLCYVLIYILMKLKYLRQSKNKLSLVYKDLAKRSIIVKR